MKFMTEEWLGNITVNLNVPGRQKSEGAKSGICSDFTHTLKIYNRC